MAALRSKWHALDPRLEVGPQYRQKIEPLEKVDSRVETYRVTSLARLERFKSRYGHRSTKIICFRNGQDDTNSVLRLIIYIPE
jgi:hypothetical protein